MIRLKLFFSAILAALLLAGCAKDDQNLPPVDDPGLKTYLRIYIPRTTDIQSRTIGTPTAPGTTEENRISDITVYLVNGGQVIKIENIGMTGSSDSFVSDLIPVGTNMLDQEYQLFLVANPEKAGFDPRSTADFKGEYSTQEDTYRLVTLGQMVMSNQVEQSPVPTIVVTKENTKENPAKAHVRLDRLAAKIVPQVSVDFKADFTNHPKEEAFFKDYTFTVEAAGLLNAATEFNLEQLWSEGAGGEPIQLLSPTWYYKPEETYFNRYYQTLKEYADQSQAPFVSFSEKAVNGFRPITDPFYCLENNSPFYDYTGSPVSPENQVKTKYKGLTTGVLFRMQAKLNGEAATFYKYNGKYYADTEADRQELATAAGVQTSDFSNASALREKEVQVYEEGNIYYTYWIKDKNAAYAGDDYDLSYSVIRNSWYILQVLSMTRIGDDVPGDGYEPEEPIDRIEQVEIIAVCQDWTLVDVTHEFN